MSGAPKLRRTDRQMSTEAVRALLERGYCGRLASVGADGFPYIVPLLYVWMENRIYVHNALARGHFRENIERDSRVCFEMDEPGEVFPYGRFECDTALSYRSVIAFGAVRVVEDREEKARFCTALMEKYGRSMPERAKSFFPRLDQIAVYAMAVESMTGKETPLPAKAEQWPASDRTKSPAATPP
jgi:nitroimidazol reductase NimA-like FMN-containing flavoprotein (pyridoxamine 5'-phosphate oxidase superfamily)